MKQVQKAKPVPKKKATATPATKPVPKKRKATATPAAKPATSTRKRPAAKGKAVAAAATETPTETLQVPLTNGAETKGRAKKRKLPEKASAKRESSQETMETESTSEDMMVDEELDAPNMAQVIKRTAPGGDEEHTQKKSKRSAETLSVQQTSSRSKFALDVPVRPSTSGFLFVVGTNDCGQLGLSEDVPEQEVPIQSKSKLKFTSAAAGGMHSVCLTEDGEVYTFGCNDEGALGRVTEGIDGAEFGPAKVAIPEDKKVVKVSAGDSHSAALTEDGDVFIWGNFRGKDGPMGLLESGTKSIKPIQILRNERISSIASGNDHLACLSSNGVVYTLGCGDAGQLGRITERSATGEGRTGFASLLTPKPVVIKVGKIPLKVKDIWCGGYDTFFKTFSGEVYACGLNNRKQLGIPGGDDEQNVFFPKHVVSFSADYDWKQIGSGQHHTLALDKDGNVYSFGNKIYGRLGLGPVPNDDSAQDPVSAPTIIQSLKKECLDIAAGNVTSFAVTKTGQVFSWGMGTGFQLGHGDEDDVFIPKAISALDSWKAFKIAAGSQHTLVLANKKT